MKGMLPYNRKPTMIYHAFKSNHRTCYLCLFSGLVPSNRKSYDFQYMYRLEQITRPPTDTKVCNLNKKVISAATATYTTHN